MAITLKKWDSAAHLKSADDIAAYLAVVLEEDDMPLLYHALGNVARSAGMAEVAKKAGLGRESLYKALDAKGNPGFSTIVKVLKALDLEISIRPAEAASDNFEPSRPRA